MADEKETPADAAAPAAESAPSLPLEKASLDDFMARRAKGEKFSATPVAEKPEKPDTEPPQAPPPDHHEPEDEEVPRETPVGEEKGKPKSRFDQRLGTLTRQRHDAERALEAERQRVLQLQEELQQYRQPKKEPAAAPVPDGQAPDLNKYLEAGKTYEDWMTALIDYRAAQKFEYERARMIQYQQQQEIQTQMAGFTERTEAAKQKYADYDDVVVANDRVQLSPVMQDIARRSPHGPDIMYWLGHHEAEANQLGELTRNYPQAAYPLVEAHLLLLSGHSQNGNSGAKKAVTVSQAPTPITPVGGGTTTQPVALDKLPLDEYMKRRAQQRSKKAGG